MPNGIQLETKFQTFQEGDTQTKGVEISGYASLFGVKDQSGDLVAPGAFEQSLKNLSASGRAVKFLWQHDPQKPIGVWDEVYEDSFGLFVRGRLIEEIALGREARAMLNAGAIDGLSIGYKTKKASKHENGGRLLEEIELWEVSLVTFPMLPEARLTTRSDDQEAEVLGLMAEAMRSAGAQF